MGLLKRHTHRNGIVNLLLVFLMTLLLSIGCSSSGGGGDDDDDDNNGDGNSIVGVWALKTTIENCGDEGTETIDFPLDVEGQATVSGYVQLTSDTKKYFIKMTDVASFLEPYGYKNGTFSCSDDEAAYSIDGNDFMSEDGTTGTYTLSGDTFTLVTTDDEDPDCTMTLVLERSNASAIANDEENCSLFDLVDL